MLATVQAVRHDGVEYDQVNDIPLFQILPGDNDRTVFPPGPLEELAASIKKDGLHEPVILRPWGYVCTQCCEHRTRSFEHEHEGKNMAVAAFQLVAGERRFLATKLNATPTILAIVRKLSDEQADAAMLDENVHRADLDPLDEAQAYHKRMDKYGWTVRQVSEKVKKNEKYVRSVLLLLDLLPEVQQMIRTGTISTSFGETMAPLDANRQRIALKYLSETTNPLLREFKALCGKLLADQASEPMFNMDELKAVEVIEQAVVDGQPKRFAAYAASKGRFPIDPELPAMQRVGGIGESFEAYLKKLMTSDDPHQKEAAPVVGRIYDSMVRYGMCFPPNPEKLAAKAAKIKQFKAERSETKERARANGKGK
jgi:ParB/RepB/Spo0J family partition protein